MNLKDSPIWEDIGHDSCSLLSSVNVTAQNKQSCFVLDDGVVGPSQSGHSRVAVWTPSGVFPLVRFNASRLV